MAIVIEVLSGIILVLMAMAIHGLGMYLVMHQFERHWQRYVAETSELKRQIYFGKQILIILLTHLLEILLWACVLILSGALSGFRTAFYFAGETYATLGFGDVQLPVHFRQLALFIAMTGLLAFGWSTGVLVSLVGKTYEVQFSKLRQGNPEPLSAQFHGIEDESGNHDTDGNHASKHH